MRTIAALLPLLEPDDVIIDGGNSNYKDTQRRAEMLKANRIHYVDAGTSGGVWGLQNGYSIMVGGDERGRRAACVLFSKRLLRQRIKAGGGSAPMAPGISPKWSITASSTA